MYIGILSNWYNVIYIENSEVCSTHQQWLVDLKEIIVKKFLFK